MFRFSIIKLPQHKSFSHSPIYYDPEKEEQERRAAEREEERSNTHSRISRGSLKESWGKSNRSSKISRNSNLRVLILIFLLATAFWYLLYN